MKGDYSWAHSANDYLKLYQNLFEPREAKSISEEDPHNPVVVEIESES